MNEKINKLLDEQKARAEADNILNSLTGNARQAPDAEVGGTYLVSSFARRDDLPLTASLRKMNCEVAFRLAEMGHREPVSLRCWPDRWWRVKVDAAEVGLVSEYGNAFVTKILSTEELMHRGFEVEGGPFNAWESREVSLEILKKHPGKFWDARIYQVARNAGGESSSPFSGVDNGYTSEALVAALDQGDSVQVFSGPYESEDDARYALDVRWEVPD